MLYRAFLELAVWPAWGCVKVDDTEVGIAEGHQRRLLDGGRGGHRQRVRPIAGRHAVLCPRRSSNRRRQDAVARLAGAGAHYVIDGVADLVPVLWTHRGSARPRRAALSDGASAEGDLNLSPLRREWAARHLDQATRALLDADERCFLRQSLSTPCLNVAEASRGSLLIDAQGREILDFHGNSVHQVGYGHPKVVAAIKAQLDTLPFCPRRYTNRAAIDLAGKLAGLFPGGPAKVLLAPSGAAAIGMALKLARHATGRHKTLSMWDCVPRRQPRHDLGRRRGDVPARSRAAAAGCRARAATRSGAPVLRRRRAGPPTGWPTTSTTCWRCRATSARCWPSRCAGPRSSRRRPISGRWSAPAAIGTGRC